MVIQEMVDEGFFGDIGNALGSAWNNFKNSGTGQSIRNGINTFKNVNKAMYDAAGRVANGVANGLGQAAGAVAKDPLRFNPNVAAYNYFVKPGAKAAYDYFNPLITATKNATNRALNSVGNAVRSGYNAVRNSSPVRNFQNGFNQSYQR